MAAPGENGEIQPSAPPAWVAGGPPSYDAVAQRGQLYPTLSRRDQLVESLQTAGESSSREKVLSPSLLSQAVRWVAGSEWLVTTRWKRPAGDERELSHAARPSVATLCCRNTTRTRFLLRELPSSSETLAGTAKRRSHRPLRLRGKGGGADAGWIGLQRR